MPQLEFKDLVLPSGQVVTVKEPKGLQYFNSLSYSKGDVGLMVKSLAQQTTFIKDKQIEFEDLDDMTIEDVVYLSEFVSTMISGQNPFKI